MKHTTITVRGVSTRVSVLGKGNPVVFLPGMVYSSIGPFLPLLKLLAREYNVYSIDLPGFGRYRPPSKNWNSDDFADFMLEVIKKLNLKEFILVGQSLGGLIGVRMAAKTKIKQLVLIDSAGIKIKDLPPVFIFRYLIYKTIRNVIIFQEVTGMLRIIKDFSYFVLNNFHRSFTWMTLRNVFHEDCEPVLKKISTPTLIVWGKDDLIFPLSDAQVFKKNIKKSRLILVEKGHDWSVIKPKPIKKIWKK